MKKTLCTVLAAGCVFLAACGASSGTTANGCTITAVKNGKTASISDEDFNKLVKLAENSINSGDMIQLSLTLDQSEDGIYILIEYPEERELNDGSENPVKTNNLEIITGTSEGALILTSDESRVYRVGSNSCSFAKKIKSYLK